MPSLFVLVIVSLLCAGAGSLGGIGGATLLVPTLLVLHPDPFVIAPLGMLTVAAGSTAASVRHLDGGLVHHRLGYLTEFAATFGVIGGAMLSTRLDPAWLTRILATGAAIGGLAILLRKFTRNLPILPFHEDRIGEWPGTLGGTYPLGNQRIPYHATHVKRGVLLSSVGGLISGISGVGGGFLKTPILSEVMHIPIKVAAATALLASGVTAATALIVYGIQGRISLDASMAVIVGALIGGELGSLLQRNTNPTAARRVTGMLLLIVATVILVQGL